MPYSQEVCNSLFVFNRSIFYQALFSFQMCFHLRPMANAGDKVSRFISLNQ